MPRTILIVAADGGDRLTLREALGERCAVKEAGDAKAALNLLSSAYGDICAALIDWALPGGEAPDLVSRMRDDPALSHIPVLAAANAGTDELEVLQAGAQGVLARPYDAARLNARLSNLIRLREGASPANAATRDRLTGLLNRESFFEEAEKRIRQREAGHYVLSAFDIDKFTVINDQYGSEKGDEVLRAVAGTIQTTVSAIGGLCCRISSDNFALLFPADQMNSDEVSKNHIAAATCDASIPPLRFSVGRYVVNDLSLSVSAMYDRALLAMASVKGHFDNHIGLYDESMRREMLRTQNIYDAMKPALSGGQFEVWFQPQYNNITGALIGAEALARWRHPEHGMIPPGEFIPVFEKNGFIFEMDKFIWEQTCACLRDSLDQRGQALPISVNVSRYDIFRAELCDVLVGLIEKYALPADLLRLEITETAFSSGAEQIISVVKQLVELGFTVEIDDFGSGYSSLNTLKDVPAQIVKLDMRFLEGTDNLERGGSIIESVVRMARWLGMAVIAEGVETPLQAQYLKSIGCNYAQGYLFGRPMPHEEYAALLAKGSRAEKLIALRTVENLDNNAFWDPASMDTLIFNSYVGAACILEYSKNHIAVLRATDAFAKQMNELGLGMETAMTINWAEHMQLRDLCLFSDAMTQSLEMKENVVNEYVFHHLPGCPEKVYLNNTQRVIATIGDRYMIYNLSEDRTAQREAERQKLEAEQKERDLAVQMRAVLAGISGGVLATVRQGGKARSLFSNDQFYALLGYDKAQFEAELPRGLWDAIPPTDRERARNGYEAFLASGSDASMEFRAVRRDGRVVWLHANGSICHFEGVEEPVSLVVYTDITTEKANAQKISDAEQIQAIMRNVNGGMAAMTVEDGKPRYIFFNDQYSAMFGYTKDQFVQELDEEGIRALIPLEYEYKVAATAAVSEITGRESTVEFPVRCRDGRMVWVRAHNSVSKMASFDAPVHISVLEDITLEREAQERILSLNESLQTMMADMPGGFVRYLPLSDGLVEQVYVNDGYCKLIQMTREEIMRACENDSLWGVHPNDCEKVRAALDRMIDTGEEGNVKYRLRRGDGQYVWVSVFGRMTQGSGARFLNLYYSEPSERERRDLTIRETLPFVLSATMEFSADIVFAKDKNLHYIYGSPAFVRYAKRAAVGEIVGKTDFDLFARDVAEQYRYADERLLAGEASLVDRLEPIASDDHIQHFASISKYALRDSSGELLGIYGIGKDVTDIRQAYERLSLLTESVPGGIASYILTQGEIKITYFNDGFCKVLGCTRAQYEAYVHERGSVLSRVYPEDLPRLTAQIEALRKDGTPIDCIYRAERFDGGCVWFNLRGVLSGQKDNVAYINTVLYDVTAQREAERKEHDTAERMRAITENVHAGILAVTVREDRHAHLFANDQYYEMFGYTRSQMEAERPGGLTALIEPEDLPALTRAVKAIEQTGKRQKTEFRARKRDGSLMWVRCRSSVCDIDGVGQTVHVAVLHEVTREKEAEKKILDADEKLRFLNDVAHDLMAQPEIGISIERMLRKILDHFGGSRAYMFEKSADGRTISNTYEVCAPGVTSEIANLQNFPSDFAAAWNAAFESGGYIDIADVSALDGNREAEKRLLERQGISALVAVPFVRDGQFIGFIGVDDPTRQMEHVEQLCALSDYLTVMLMRRDYTARIESDQRFMHELMLARSIDEEAARHAVLQRQYDLTLENMPGFVAKWLFKDGDVLMLDANQKYLDFMNISAEDAFGRSIIYGFTPEQKAEVIAMLYEKERNRENIAFVGRACKADGSECRLRVQASFFGDKGGCSVYFGTLTEIAEPDAAGA